MEYHEKWTASNALTKYRGYEWERFGAFCERMLNKHPGAHLMRSPGEPPVDIRYGSDQYIQCTAVMPEPDRNLPVFTNPDVPLAVRTYYEHRCVDSVFLDDVSVLIYL